MPTITDLITAARARATTRYELLLLLALLAGLLTSLFYKSSVNLIDQTMLAFSQAQGNEAQVKAAVEILTGGIGTIVFGQLALIAITAFLIVPWARAISPNELLPNAGGLKALFGRGFLAGKYLILVAILTMSSIVIVAPIIVGVSQMMGGLDSLVMLAGAVSLLWLNFMWSSIANYAISRSSEDKPTSFKQAKKKTDAFVRPITSLYAILWLLAGVINVLLSNLVMQTLPADIAQTLSLIISGALSFLTIAIHLTALYDIPELNE